MTVFQSPDEVHIAKILAVIEAVAYYKVVLDRKGAVVYLNRIASSFFFCQA